MGKQKESQAAVKFFDFGNRMTFHVFTWATEFLSPAECEQLIDQARENAEEAEPEACGEDLQLGWQGELGKLLEERAFDALCRCQAPEARPRPSSQPFGAVGRNVYAWNTHKKAILDATHHLHNDTAALWMPILSIAACQIEFDAVAEALLIRAGKWQEY